MVDPHTTGCPEPEVLAAYVDRGLSLAERARVDAHLASCPQCIAQLAGVARTVAEVTAHKPDIRWEAEATPFFTRRSLAGALAAAAAVIAVLALPSLVRPWLDRDARLVGLVESVGEQRSVLGRLTGGFPHAPLGVPSAGGQDGRAAETDRVLLTTGRIRESFGERETPARLHAIGLSQLLSGRYDDAAQSLLAASREQPANAKYLSDVAAVQLERARLGLRPDDLPRALAAADRARRLDPSLKEAWFNRALAASALTLTADARNAWTEYLKRDSVSPWGVEARTRLQELAKPTPAEAWTSIEVGLQQLDATTADAAVRTQATEARSFFENLLVQWADAALAGGGATELQRLRVMADAILRVSGDAFSRDVVGAIDAAESRGPSAVSALAQAHKKYAAAAVPYNNDQYVQAEAGLRDANVALTAAETPFAMRAALDLASVAYVRSRYDESNALAEAAATVARNRNYIFNTGRAVWMQGLVAFVLGRHADAQTKYEDALAEFERSHDEEQTAAAHNLVATLFYYLGDEGQAWAHLIPALRGLDITRSLKLRHALLSSAAAHTMRIDRDAALAIQDEVVKNAEAWGREAAIAEALLQRATIRAALGQASAAEIDLAGARQKLPLVEPALSARLEPTTLAVESDLMRAKNPAGAVHGLERAIALVEARGDRIRLAQMQLKLAQANIVWGHTAQAEAALAKGIKAFDQERGKMADEGRLSAHDESWGLFETAVQLAIQKNDLERAFAMSERARVRSLAEARKVTAPRNLKEVQAALGPEEAIVALNQFDDELAIWVLRAKSAEVVRRPLARRDAERLVARHRDDIWEESSSTVAGAALFNEILRPISAQLRGATRLIIVPDTTYKDTSFAALWNTTNGRFVVESSTVRVAPSANAYAESVVGNRALASVSEPLIVGPIGASDSRVKAVAGVYPSSSLLLGASATRTRLLSDAGSRSIVHLSAPVAGSAINPLLSRLVVADDPGARHSGAITGSEIAARQLPQTRLVVLDEIGTDRSVRGEGTLSVARAFMAAGVPAVVGTLPGADENATRDLMIGFHREMSKGISAEQALQTVQRNAVEQNGRRLGAWSALVLYGSDR
jgi:CHAT domain-containing protein